MDLSGISVIEAPVTTPVGERILGAAGALFFTRGITAVGVELIAERAETTKRTLYQRFGSKEGLISAYLQQRAHAWQTGLIQALSADRAGTPEAALRAVFDASERMAAEHRRGCAFVNAWAELGPEHSGASRIIEVEKAWMRDLFRRIVADEAAAMQIHMIYEGAQVLAAILDDHRAYDRAVTAAMALLDRPGSAVDPGDDLVDLRARGAEPVDRALGGVPEGDAGDHPASVGDAEVFPHER